jgi:hypothetical protein
MINDEKILTLNLDGKKGVNILKSKYDMMSITIITILKNKGQVTLSELGEEVEAELQNKFDGKIGWYLMAVKLDLEARGIIVRLPNKTQQTLKMS